MARSLDDAMASVGVDQAELARRLEVHPNMVWRWCHGGELRSDGKRVTGLVRYDKVEDCELALRVPLGTIARGAGFVDDKLSARKAVLADPAIGPHIKRMLVDFFDSVVGQLGDDRRQNFDRRPSDDKSGPRSV